MCGVCVYVNACACQTTNLSPTSRLCVVRVVLRSTKYRFAINKCVCVCWWRISDEAWVDVGGNVPNKHHERTKHTAQPSDNRPTNQPSDQPTIRPTSQPTETDPPAHTQQQGSHTHKRTQAIRPPSPFAQYLSNDASAH